ncbi:indoleamine 2,3-dioxygenase 1-like [Polyodon spathula]|uniref:indoleamine 2,3-dioxygenase 1-like n=1 Tax=Polyodon spathula TaxID=7913 RepID=UPI001B7DBB09|nr:indoleamine 2,3-dioxygenase 1-like [Polyodon spathula]
MRTLSRRGTAGSLHFKDTMDKDLHRLVRTQGIDLQQFCVSEEYGFVLSDPLTDLPEYYQPWMEIAKHVPGLIENHQIRSRVNEMPLLSTDHLQGHRERRLAHLALGFITMGYVWQEGVKHPSKVLPRSLAVPYCEISELLGLPPILVYADSVLANWKRKDPNGPVEIRNLDTIFTFPGGDCARGFFLVSLIVEMAAATGIKAIATALNSMPLHDTSSLHGALLDIAKSLNKMREAFKLMHDNVDPGDFYGQLRTFLHGWRDNLLLPEGMLYEGVWEEPKHYSGGSAAQSSAIQCFDEFLGIRHGFDYDAPYLYRMRDYMPPAHRALIQTIAAGPSARHHIIATGSTELCHAYNKCITALVELRNYHINTVVKYITIPANKGKVTSGCIFQIHSSAVATRGTGGTGLMCFLKSVRDTTRRVLINDI